MRKVHTLGVTLFCGAIAIACGGTATSDNPPGSTGNDAGYDATSGNNPPIGTDAGDANVSSGDDDDSGACIIDANILTLAPADAEINDAGATVGTCLACAQTTCSSQLDTCNADCSCNTGFTCFANCIGGIGNTLLSCAGQCFGSLSALEQNPAELGVVSCAGQSCTDQCGTASILGGGGGKKGDGGGGGNKDDGGDSLDGATD